MDKITKLLSQKITSNKDKISDFFNDEFSLANPLFYNSVDIRNSGFKVAAVDTNCFPAGFNNLRARSIEKAIKEADNLIKNKYPNAKNIIIIPENNNRNANYAKNIEALYKIVAKNYNVKIGAISKDDDHGQYYEINNQKTNICNLQKDDCGNLYCSDFKADLIILNNDLSDGMVEILNNSTTNIIPTPKIGWYNRSKYQHFSAYNDIALKIATIIDIDPWLITTEIELVENIDFKEKIGIDELANKVELILGKTKKHYIDNKINLEPACYIKADSGTYGMAVWMVQKVEDVININKKNRNKMNITKGLVKNSQVIIQEAIPTIHKIDNKSAEPLLYMINGQVVGNLFRVNENKDNINSLNSAGANFYDILNLDSKRINQEYNSNELRLVNDLIAKIAALASSKEANNK